MDDPERPGGNGIGAVELRGAPWSCGVSAGTTNRSPTSSAR